MSDPKTIPDPSAAETLDHHRVIAANHVGRVSLCACGIVHLHVGGTVLQMEPGRFYELADLLNQGVLEHAVGNTDIALLAPPWTRRRGSA